MFHRVGSTITIFCSCFPLQWWQWEQWWWQEDINSTHSNLLSVQLLWSLHIVSYIDSGRWGHFSVWPILWTSFFFTTNSGRGRHVGICHFGSANRQRLRKPTNSVEVIQSKNFLYPVFPRVRTWDLYSPHFEWTNFEDTTVILQWRTRSLVWARHRSQFLR